MSTLRVIAGLVLVGTILAGSRVQAEDVKTKYDNGTSGYYLKQSPGPVIPLHGHEIVAGIMDSHSTIVAQDGQRIYDSEFISLVTSNLQSAGSATYETLLIHMAQCFSGGFIDEIEDNSISDVSINTAAWHATTSWGSEATNPPQNFYSYQWNLAVDKDSANNKMLDAYTTATAADQKANSERPQYYSYGASAGAGRNALDNTTLGASSDKNLAMIFVGDDRDSSYDSQTGQWVYTEGKRHYYDARLIQDKLKEIGYTDSDISVYYADGSKPAGAPDGLTIDGSGTEANFDAFFQTVLAGNVSGNNDQILVWVSDHGGNVKGVIGRWRLALAAVGEAKATLKLDLKEALKSATLEGGLSGLGAAYLGVAPLDGMMAGDTVEVLLGDFQGDNAVYVGSMTTPGSAGYFEVTPGTFDDIWASNLAGGAGTEQGAMTVIFHGPRDDIIVNDFELGWTCQIIPEPAMLVFLALGGLATIRRGRPV